MIPTPEFSPSSRARALLLVAAFLLIASSTVTSVVSAQQKGRTEATLPDAAQQSHPLKRTTSRREVRRLGYGGMVTLYGAPEGSITIEAWPKSEVELTADIELSADTEDELARLAAVNSFVLDADLNHLRIVTTGTHDRQYMKRVARDFPKKLLAMPWKIDYRLRVPAATDLEIYAGRGPLSITEVEGALRLNAGGGDTTLTLSGGDLEATIERGPVTFRVPSRSWRGRGASLRLAGGELSVELPANFSGDINAEVLRAGRIENSHGALVPREDAPSNERALHARGGAGGATLSFTVGDGTLRIRQESARQQSASGKQPERQR